MFARERAGRTPRELAVKLRDDSIQALEKLKDGSSQLKIEDASRGDFDLIMRLLADAESKRVDIREEPRSIVQKGNFAKEMKKRQLAALGNALTGIYCCFIPITDLYFFGSSEDVFDLLAIFLHDLFISCLFCVALAEWLTNSKISFRSFAAYH